MTSVTVDLHLHSTASDGECDPARVVDLAAARGLAAIALTDHDTVAGVSAAQAAGARLSLRVVGGCEFSVAAPWGEMHVLGYFLPPDSPPLEDFLAARRADRLRRAEAMVGKLAGVGVNITFDSVLREAGGGALGRPHVARALVRQRLAGSLDDAFDRFLGRGRPAFVPKSLPEFGQVAELVHQVGGIVSAAHLNRRGTRTALKGFKAQGLDAVETRHPSHDPDVRARLTDLALELGLLRTGGSDWHGDGLAGESHGPMGSQQVPLEWLTQLDARGAAG
ncbi:MAG: PHP domain-containing protein [Gemmatimonadales bacterium]